MADFWELFKKVNQIDKITSKRLKTLPIKVGDIISCTLSFEPIDLETNFSKNLYEHNYRFFYTYWNDETFLGGWTATGKIDSTLNFNLRDHVEEFIKRDISRGFLRNIIDYSLINTEDNYFNVKELRIFVKGVEYTKDIYQKLQHKG